MPYEDFLKSYLTKNWDVFDKAGFKGVVFLYDEFHEVRDIPEKGRYVLADFIGAINDVQRDGFRYCCVLAGLPNLTLNVKDSRSYTERMFSSLSVGNLDAQDAIKAIEEPLKNSGYHFSDDLVKKVADETLGYPYFIQLYGKEIISNVPTSSISLADFVRVRPLIIKELDDSFFSPRFDLASEGEQRVLCSLTRIRGNDLRFADIRKASRVERRSLTNYLKRLGEKGLIYQHHKEMYRLSLPLLRDYLVRRCVPST